MNIFIDIETCPSQSIEVMNRIISNISPPKTYTKQESIDKWIEDNLEKEIDNQLRKTSLNGGYGHICVIGVAIENDEPVTFYSNDWLNDEKLIINNSFKYILSKTKFDSNIYDIKSNINSLLIGHNIINFDIKFLIQRSIILGCKIPEIFTANYKNNIFDTMQKWCGYKEYIKLDELANILGIKGKNGIDGSMVWDLVKDGRIEEISEYCKDDIRITREIFNKMKLVL